MCCNVSDLNGQPKTRYPVLIYFGVRQAPYCVHYRGACRCGITRELPRTIMGYVLDGSAVCKSHVAT